MIVTYEDYDVVEWNNSYWTVVNVNRNGTLDLKNKAGRCVDDVPIDQLHPTGGTLRGATYRTF